MACWIWLALALQDAAAEQVLGRIEEKLQSAKTLRATLSEETREAGKAAGRVASIELALKRSANKASLRDRTSNEHLVSDGIQMGNATSSRDAPPLLGPGLIAAFARGGAAAVRSELILDRSSRFDRTGSKVDLRTIYQVSRCAAGPDEGDLKTIGYTLDDKFSTVEVKLAYDPKTLLPARRTLRRADGRTLVETYEKVVLDAEIGDEEFRFPASNAAGEAAAREPSCAEKLADLWKRHQLLAKIQRGRARKNEVGAAFWQALRTNQPPMVDATEENLLVCTPWIDQARWAFTTFRGPPGDLATLKDEDPVGCCEPGLHPDGTIAVLLKNGSVSVVRPADKLHARAVSATTGRPGFDDMKKVLDCYRDLDKLTVALAAYRFDKGAYPATGNAALVKALETKKLRDHMKPERFNAAGELLDPWGKPFQYVLPGCLGERPGAYDLYSTGPNGRDDRGEADDLLSRPMSEMPVLRR